MYKIQDLIETYFLANNKLKLSQNSALIQMKILNKNKILNIELMEPTKISPYTDLAIHKPRNSHKPSKNLSKSSSIFSEYNKN